MDFARIKDIDIVFLHSLCKASRSTSATLSTAVSNMLSAKRSAAFSAKYFLQRFSLFFSQRFLPGSSILKPDGGDTI